MEVHERASKLELEAADNDRIQAFLRDIPNCDLSSPVEDANASPSKSCRSCGVDSMMEVDELERRSDDFPEDDDEEECADVLGEMGLTTDQLKQIAGQKSTNPEMFVSSWEDDDKDIEEKNLKDPNEQFLTAAEDGAVDVLRRMLALNPDFIKEVDSDEYTALHRAAYNNHLEAVRFLLEAGADPEARTSSGWTVLHSAAVWANFNVVGILLSHGVQVNALSNGHLSALHLAVSSQEDPNNVFHTVRYLLQAPGIDTGLLSGAGDTALALARRSSPRLFQLIQDFHDKI